MKMTATLAALASAAGSSVLRITVLANRDLASCIALNRLLPRLQEHANISVFLSSVVGRKKPPKDGLPPPPQELKQLRFFEQQLFNDAIFPIVDASATDDADEAAVDRLRSFQGLHEYTCGPIETLNDINGEDFERFAASTPDLVLSIRYGVILRDEAIAVPRHGVLNLHSGRLPEYRGVMASFHALRNGERTLGMTLHSIDDRTIDTGRILGRTELMVDPDASYLSHVLALYEDGVNLLIEAVEAIAEGKPMSATPQPAETRCAPGQNYYTFPTREELDQFGAMGFELVKPEEVLALARRFGARESVEVPL